MACVMPRCIDNVAYDNDFLVQPDVIVTCLFRHDYLMT